ncbi:hypothetical protein C1645_870672 [Glomus cerebriforme]|uniref:F-box domain-containing protein n=1 Tax=Glomus cerebriforme TaxID=658196 RepID=A0A397TPN2_9GLOM|nr:hypothetical protein C1645_870672 [Glomus cerebriforme]
MVKSKRSGFPISFSTSSFHHSFSNKSLQEFPTELLLLTFNEFDIPTLLNICNVCKRFQQIGSKVLSKKFKEPKIGLLLTFEQEHKWRFNIPFEFSKFNEQNGKFIFKPQTKQVMRFIHSSMIRSPVLSKISIMGLNHNESSSSINEIHLPSNTITTTTNINNNNIINNNNHQSSTTSSNSSIKPKKLEENFLQKSLTLDIKSHKETLNKVQHVYRIGHGTTHLRIPYRFNYSIVDTPPPSTQKTRGGERWLTPISFECSPSFFYPHEPTAHKIIMTIIHLRKRNLHKKKSSLPQTQNYKQKQRAIDFEEVEDYISIEFTNDHNSTKSKRLFERQIDQLLSKKGPPKNKYGARS